MVRLGGMYENGEGVPQDYIKAHMWYNLSSGFWDAGLDEERDGSGEERDALSDKMSREQIAEAQKMASNWLEEYKDSKANNN
jgi:uncharacterized protein